MAPTLAILTGASRGLGRAMAERLLGAGTTLLTISRRPDDDALQPLAAARGAALVSWAADLADPAPLCERLAAWLAANPAAADGTPWSRVRLIHNAALLNAPGPLEAAAADELSATLRVGLEAPVLLTAAFLRATVGWASADRRILLISSGLGRRPMAGSAPYCAIKAGMDHFARALALDEALQPHGARVVSLAPGVIDTDMQRQLRGADAGRFPERARFAELHRSGSLASPQAAAAQVLAVLEREDFGSAPVADVRDG